MADDPKSRTETWYTDGLRFSCHGCGACCRVEGYVWVDSSEIDSIAEYLNLDRDDFGRRYLRAHRQRHALTETADHDCIFWDDGCAIYPVRPSQCRTYPFWPEVLRTADTWKQEERYCGGLNQGRLYSIGEIQEIRHGRSATATGPDSEACGCGKRSPSR